MSDGLDADIKTLHDAHQHGYPAPPTNPLARLIAPSLAIGRETLTPRQVRYTRAQNDKRARDKGFLRSFGWV